MIKEIQNIGVIYCAISSKYVSEAIYSAKTLKKANSNIRVTLFTNMNVNNNLFDNVIHLKSNLHPWQYKIHCIINSPYYYTLYLDTDTKILLSIKDTFHLLEDYDVLIAAVRNWVNGKLISFEKSFPNSNFKRMNTGVIFYRKSPNFMSFCQVWRENVGKINGIPTLGIDCDQAVFNELYITNTKIIKIKLLKNIEFNCRLIFLPYLNKIEIDSIKIIHQHYLYFPFLLRIFYNWKIYYRYIRELYRAKIEKIMIS